MTDTDVEWHGWSIAKVDGSDPDTWHVGRIPDRKSVALYRLQKGSLTPAAYFHDEDLAKSFLRFLDRLGGA